MPCDPQRPLLDGIQVTGVLSPLWGVGCEGGGQVFGAEVSLKPVAVPSRRVSFSIPAESCRE